MDRVQMKLKSKNQIRGKLGMLFLCLFIILVICTVLGVIPFVGWIGLLLLAPALGAGYYGIYLNVARDVEPQAKDLFKYINYFLKALGLFVLTELIVLAGCILLLVPGIILAFALSQVMYIFADNPDMKIMDIISTSMSMMKGHKFDYFVLELSFLGWLILGSLTFHILTFAYVIPYYTTTTANFYLNLKDKYIGQMSNSTESPSPSSTQENSDDTPWEIK